MVEICFGVANSIYMTPDPTNPPKSKQTLLFNVEFSGKCDFCHAQLHSTIQKEADKSGDDGVDKNEFRAFATEKLKLDG